MDDDNGGAGLDRAQCGRDMHNHNPRNGAGTTASTRHAVLTTTRDATMSGNVWRDDVQRRLCTAMRTTTWVTPTHDSRSPGQSRDCDRNCDNARHRRAEPPPPPQPSSPRRRCRARRKPHGANEGAGRDDVLRRGARAVRRRKERIWTVSNVTAAATAATAPNCADDYSDASMVAHDDNAVATTVTRL